MRSSVSGPGQGCVIGGEQPALLLLTGQPGAGKSTACLRLAARLAEQGQRVAGLVTIMAGPRRYLWDVERKERRLLAAEDEELDGPQWGRYQFSQETFEWGNTVLQQAAVGKYGLAILDEVGPVELVRHTGFLPGLQALLASNNPILVVVRPALVEALRALAPARPTQSWDLNWQNREELPGQIAAWLRNAV